jgi:hypothetical protein
MTFGHFQQGQRCSICAGNTKFTAQKVKTIIENRKGHELLSKEYKNARTKLQIRCPEGHEFDMSFDSFQHGHGCPVCAGNKRLTIEKVRDFTKTNSECTLLSTEYIDGNTKLQFRCPEGHLFSMRFCDFRRGNRCPTCARQKRTSKGEKEVLAYIKSIYKGTIKPNDFTQIINPKTGFPLELDIYLPEINLAIEYNGIYWHSAPYQKYKDEQKIIQCQQKNINLLIITDAGWCKKKNKNWHDERGRIKTEIKNQIGLMTIKKNKK